MNRVVGNHGQSAFHLTSNEARRVFASIRTQTRLIADIRITVETILAEIAALQPPVQGAGEKDGAFRERLKEFQEKLHAVEGKLRQVQDRMAKAERELSRLQTQELPKADKEGLQKAIDQQRQLLETERNRITEQMGELLRQQAHNDTLKITVEQTTVSNTAGNNYQDYELGLVGPALLQVHSGAAGGSTKYHPNEVLPLDEKSEAMSSGATGRDQEFAAEIDDDGRPSWIAEEAWTEMTSSWGDEDWSAYRSMLGKKKQDPGPIESIELNLTTTSAAMAGDPIPTDDHGNEWANIDGDGNFWTEVGTTAEGTVYHMGFNPNEDEVWFKTMAPGESDAFMVFPMDGSPG